MVLDRETDGIHSTIHCSPVNDPEQATALSFADFISMPDIYNILYFFLKGEGIALRFQVVLDVASVMYRQVATVESPTV